MSGVAKSRVFPERAAAAEPGKERMEWKSY